MVKPNFFILGAPKCGTTTIASWLRSHPRVFMSSIKEPHFFYSPHNPEMSRGRYESLFLSAKRYPLVGEASVWYLYGAHQAIPAIEEYTAGVARYIVCIRNPLEMAPSLHAQKVFSGHELITDFEAAWDLSNIRRQGNHEGVFGMPEGDPGHLAYEWSCQVGRQLSTLLNLVPSERVHLVFLDDIREHPEEVWKRLLAFLCLDSCHVDLNSPKNPATKRRSLGLHRQLMRMSRLRQILGLKNSTGILAPLLKANTRVERYPTPHRTMMLRMLEAFGRDIEIIEEVSGRDLSAWRHVD